MFSVGKGGDIAGRDQKVDYVSVCVQCTHLCGGNAAARRSGQEKRVRCFEPDRCVMSASAA